MVAPVQKRTSWAGKAALPSDVAVCGVDEEGARPITSSNAGYLSLVDSITIGALVDACAPEREGVWWSARRNTFQLRGAVDVEVARADAEQGLIRRI